MVEAPRGTERALLVRMRIPVLFGAILGVISTLVVPVSNASAQEGSRRTASRAADMLPACGDVLAFQVLLAGHGFSSGEIDGRSGANTRRALKAFQEANRLKPTGTPD